MSIIGIAQVLILINAGMAEPMVYEIMLSNSDEVALVSTREDYDLVRQYNWNLNKQGYVQSTIAGSTVTIHRLLMHNHIAPGLCVDHINHDRLDNRRENLRVCTYQQNGRNRRGWGKSYKGVNKMGKKWAVFLTINRKSVYFGVYDTAEEAARVYDNRAVAFYGEFAQLNFPA